jgi:hypothetical protein
LNFTSIDNRLKRSFAKNKRPFFLVQNRFSPREKSPATLTESYLKAKMGPVTALSPLAPTFAEALVGQKAVIIPWLRSK